VPVVAAFVYQDGRRVREATLEEVGQLELAANEFVWIGLFAPDEAELRTLQKRFRLHPLAIEDALNAHQVPKVEVYGDELFVVVKTAHMDGDDVRYGETHVFVGPQHLVTVRHGSARSHAPLRSQLEAAPSLLRHGPDYVLHAILDYVVDGYLPIIDTIEEAVLEMEHKTLDSFLSRAEITRLFHLRRTLLRFDRGLDPMEEVASRLEHGELPCIDDNVRLYFRDVADHVRRVSLRADALRDVLASVFEVGSLLEQQRQGAITRKLAAWAAILAAPTAIAGVYGMNFEYMPELTWRWGYFAVLAFIAAVCLGLYVSFKRSKWL
jgi:magnesium transporter